MVAAAAPRYIEPGARFLITAQVSDSEGTLAQGGTAPSALVRLRTAVAAKGGEKVDGLPYEVRAAVFDAQGKATEAAAARQAAAAAYRDNPDAP